MKIGNDPREKLWAEWMYLRKFKAGKATCMKNILDFADFRASKLAEPLYVFAPSIESFQSPDKEEYENALNSVAEVILYVNNDLLGEPR